MTLAIPLEIGREALAGSRGPRASATVPVTVYGTLRCGRTLRIRRHLGNAGIDHRFINLDLHRGTLRQIREFVGEVFATPVILLDGEWLIAPTADVLQEALRRHGMDVGRDGRHPRDLR
jgi:hypothetical protein